MTKSHSARLLLLLLAGAGCVWPSPERQLLQEFFEACRAYDTTVLARLGAAPCNPRTDGVVQGFEITRVDRAPDTRSLTIHAQIRSFEGELSERSIAVALAREDGRWKVSELRPLPASQTSPEASSARPN